MKHPELHSRFSVTGVYNDDTGAISDKYNLEITPAGWTFAIWGFIYAYQVKIRAFRHRNLFRKEIQMNCRGWRLVSHDVSFSPFLLNADYFADLLADVVVAQKSSDGRTPLQEPNFHATVDYHLLPHDFRSNNWYSSYILKREGFQEDERNNEKKNTYN